MPTPAPTKRPAAGATKAAAVGQPVWFYGDRKRALGMKSIDDSVPFAAFVASSTNDRLVNVLVVDHLGTTFALQDVPLFQGDDKDDLTAPSHCELNAPMPFVAEDAQAPGPVAPVPAAMGAPPPRPALAAAPPA